MTCTLYTSQYRSRLNEISICKYYQAEKNKSTLRKIKLQENSCNQL